MEPSNNQTLVEINPSHRIVLEYTEKLEDLIALQPKELSFDEKLLRIDRLACLTLSQELIVQESNLLWFFSLMITLLDYYLLRIDGVFDLLESTILDEYPPMSVFQKLTLHHIYRFKKEVLSNVTQTVYNEQIKDYLNLRDKLRKIVEQCLKQMELQSKEEREE